MIDFERDDWEEQMLLDDLTKPDLFGSRKRIEESVLDILQTLDIYFENIAIREDNQIYRDIHDLFQTLRYTSHALLLKNTPLKTTEIYREIAHFIDGLVLYGAQKGQAIEATADWLGKGKDVVEKAAKTHCRVKFETKSQIAKFATYKKGYPLMAKLKLLPFIRSQKRPFIAKNNEIQSAYDLMMSDLEAFEGKNFLPR